MIKILITFVCLKTVLSVEVCPDGTYDAVSHTHNGHEFHINQPSLRSKRETESLISAETRYKQMWEKRWMYKDFPRSNITLEKGEYKLSDRVWFQSSYGLELNLPIVQLISRYSECKVDTNPSGYTECITFWQDVGLLAGGIAWKICCREPSVNLVCLDISEFATNSRFQTSIPYKDWVHSIHPNDPIIYWKDDAFCAKNGTEDRVLLSYSDLPLIEGERTKHVHEVITHEWSIRRSRQRRGYCALVCFGVGEMLSEDDVRLIIEEEVFEMNADVVENRKLVKEAKFELIRVEDWVKEFMGITNKNFERGSRRMDIIDSTVRMSNSEINRVAAIIVRDTIALKLMEKHLKKERDFVMNISLDGIAHETINGCWEVNRLDPNFTSHTENNSFILYTRKPPAINTDIDDAKGILGMSHIGFGMTTTVIFLVIVIFIIFLIWKFKKKSSRKQNSVNTSSFGLTNYGKGETPKLGNIYSDIKF